MSVIFKPLSTFNYNNFLIYLFVHLCATEVFCLYIGCVCMCVLRMLYFYILCVHFVCATECAAYVEQVHPYFIIINSITERSSQDTTGKNVTKHLLAIEVAIDIFKTNI